MQIISIKVNDSSKEVLNAQAGVNDGIPTIIKANKGLNFQLIDEAKEHSPSHIMTKRSGDDLFISIDEGADIADIVIEGFYTSDSMLIGVDEKGQNFYYISNSGEIADLVTELSSGDVKMQVLGGEPQLTPYWVGAASQPAESINESGGILPWLAGITLVGGGIAIASSDDDDSKDHETSDDSLREVEDESKDVVDNKEINSDKEDVPNETSPKNEGELQPEQIKPVNTDENKVDESAKQDDTDEVSNNETSSEVPDVSSPDEDTPNNIDEAVSGSETTSKDNEVNAEAQGTDTDSDNISISDVLTDYKPKKGYSLVSKDESIEIDLVDTNTQSDIVYENNTNTPSVDSHVYAESNLISTSNLHTVDEGVII